MTILAGVSAIHEIVGAHHHLRLGILESDLEGQQVTLPCGTFINHGIGLRASGFLIVHGEMLWARDHILVLDGLEVRRGDPPCQNGILALGLKRAAIARLSGREIHIPSEVHIHAKGAHFPADDLAVFVSLIQVPGCGAGDGRRKRSRRPHSARVRVQKIRNSESRYARDPADSVSRAKRILNREISVHELKFLIQGHLSEEEVRALVGVRWRRWRRWRIRAASAAATCSRDQ